MEGERERQTDRQRVTKKSKERRKGEREREREGGKEREIKVVVHEKGFCRWDGQRFTRKGVK